MDQIFVQKFCKKVCRWPEPKNASTLIATIELLWFDFCIETLMLSKLQEYKLLNLDNSMANNFYLDYKTSKEWQTEKLLK